MNFQLNIYVYPSFKSKSLLLLLSICYLFGLTHGFISTCTNSGHSCDNSIMKNSIRPCHNIIITGGNRQRIRTIISTNHSVFHGNCKLNLFLQQQNDEEVLTMEKEEKKGKRISFMEIYNNKVLQQQKEQEGEEDVTFSQVSKEGDNSNIMGDLVSFMKRDNYNEQPAVVMGSEVTDDITSENTIDNNNTSLGNIIAVSGLAILGAVGIIFNLLGIRYE